MTNWSASEKTAWSPQPDPAPAAKAIPDAKFLTTEECAAVLRCCERTITRMIDGEDLTGFKVRRKWLVTRASLISYIRTAIEAAAGADDSADSAD